MKRMIILVAALAASGAAATTCEEAVDNVARMGHWKPKDVTLGLRGCKKVGPQTLVDCLGRAKTSKEADACGKMQIVAWFKVK